jgi:hypothetical protein
MAYAIALFAVNIAFFGSHCIVMNGFVVFSSLGRLEKLLEWVSVYI